MPAREEHPKAADCRFVIVAPTYDHAPSLDAVLTQLDALGLPVIVVDDGSRDGTAELLRGWTLGGSSRRIVVRHASNRGKAGALRSGFAEAESRGFTHAATIDTDGQHNPADLGCLLEASLLNTSAIVIGARPDRVPGYPWPGRFGRAVSNLLIRIECGVRVFDSQSGMRIYPLRTVSSLGCRTGRYAFESEVLVRAGWAGVSVLERPISCTYHPPGGRVSHFRLGRDTLRGLTMHAGLLGRALLRWCGIGNRYRIRR